MEGRIDPYRYLKRSTTKRYDEEGNDFESECYFPVVAEGTGDVWAEKISYTSYPIQGKKYRNIGGVNIDSNLFSGTDSTLSVYAATSVTNPSRGSYITSSYGPGLGGASFGLACALCIMGCPTSVATGYLSPGRGMQNVDDTDIFQIDNLSKKLRTMKDYGIPLIFPAHGILEGKQGEEMKREYESGLYMTPAAVAKGIPYTDRYIGLVADTLLQAAALAATAYES